MNQAKLAIRASVCKVLPVLQWHCTVTNGELFWQHSHSTAASCDKLLVLVELNLHVMSSLMVLSATCMCRAVCSHAPASAPAAPHTFPSCAACATSVVCQNNKRFNATCAQALDNYNSETMLIQDYKWQAWESKAKHAANERDTALKQAADLQKQLDTQGSTAEHVSQAVRGLEQRNTAMQRQMAVKVT